MNCMLTLSHNSWYNKEVCNIKIPTNILKKKKKVKFVRDYTVSSRQYEIRRKKKLLYTVYE